MTFSIIAYDEEANEIGIALQSKMLAVGAVVPAIEANVGAIVTQSIVNHSYKVDGLHMLAKGKTPLEIVAELTDKDEIKQLRQVAVMNSTGQVATFTGKGCQPWAGGVTGLNYAIQGNRLKSEKVIKAMEESFLRTSGRLARRLLTSLEAGQTAGGDRKGQQAASLLVVKNDDRETTRKIDLRVDDSERPIQQLQRLYNLYELSFLPSPKNKIVPLEGDVAERLNELFLHHKIITKAESNKEKLFERLTTYLEENNFHARIQDKGFIDTEIITYLFNNKMTNCN